MAAGWLVLSATAAAAAAAAGAAGERAEVGRIVFATGEARVSGAQGDRPAAGGAGVNEGDVLRTGVGGHVYLRTLDGGFFILRPSSEGRVVRYRLARDEAGAEFRLEVTSGAGRVVSGAGARAAPERFRLNTPVAAIGVRGTDFTVQTTATLTRAWVESGRIVLASLGGDCQATALGPCQGGSSIELSPGALRAAEVRADLPLPVPLPAELQSPQSVSPRGPGEPEGAASQGKLNWHGRAAPGEIAASGEIATNASQIQTVAAPPRTLHWGRWQVLAGAQDDDAVRVALEKGAQWVAIGPVHGVLRETIPSLTLPREGRAEFALSAHDGGFMNEKTARLDPAQAGEARLSVDFATRGFATTLSLRAEGYPTTIVSAQGTVGSDGRLVSAPLSIGSVAGALGGPAAQEAAYVYRQRVDADVIVTGVTHWGR